MLRRSWLAAASAVFCILTVLVVLAPYMAPYGSFAHLDGSAGYVDNGWPGHGPAGLLYLLGDVFCHQEWDRSYVLNGSQMPVCIRDVGILVGLAVGFAACLLLDRRLSDRRYAVVGVCLVAVMVAEWTMEGIVGDMPVPRLLSGVSCGVGASLFLSWLLYRDNKNDVPE